MAQTLTAALRERTREAHRRLESLPYPRALAGGELPIESYVNHLRALSTAQETLEHALASTTDHHCAAAWDERTGRLPVLKQDLVRFLDPPIPDIPIAQDAAKRLAEEIRACAAARPHALLGYLYVFEGAKLGGLVIGQWARDTFGLSDGPGAAYFDADAGRVRRRWDALTRRLDRLELEGSSRTAVLAAADAAFRGVHRVMEALFPFDPDALVLRVTSLNPEAGTHPITQDPGELGAVRRTTARMLAQCPYLVLRFGERGRRFTDSDGAWLISLAPYPQALVDAQVSWLGQVLASRGIPRILLERHLEMLVEELGTTDTSDPSAALKLRAAAGHLAAARRRRIPDEQLRAIGRLLEESPELQSLRGTPGAGELVASAVADEADGLSGAIAATVGWLSDPSRFSEGWVSAVQRALEQARAGVVERP